jgi:hypothetical protein
MPGRLRIALTADLHWGPHPRGNDATEQLAEYLGADPPDLLIVAGDVGSADHFGSCLAIFAGVPCKKALVPGNHDIWVTADDPRGDSLRVYREHLPAVCRTHEFHYLDQQPLLFPEFDVGFVGNINWYDYSWSIGALRDRVPDWQTRLAAKRFTRGRHNDARFVRWPLDDAGFTGDVVGALSDHLRTTLAQAAHAIVVTHHPPHRSLSFPRTAFPSTDGLLWEAFSGNEALERLLAQHAGRIPFAFCGHTHRQRDAVFDGTQGHNIGGDYHFKRLLILEWPAGTIRSHQFGDPMA